MHRQVNAIAGRLSLRAPQRRSLEILDRITELATLKKGGKPAVALEAITCEWPTVTDFERDFPSVCFALATGVGKTRLMGAFITYLHLAHGARNFFVLAPNLTIYSKLIADFTPNTPKYVFKAKDGSTFGTVVGADRATRTLDVKKSKAHADTHPTALFAHSRAPVEVLEESIFRVAQGFIDGSPNVVAQRLLRGDRPTLRSGAFSGADEGAAVDFAVQVVGDLDRSVLAIQGPPGTGKTFCGAQMICRLIADGRRVGVAGPSHKVIRNLLDQVRKAASELRIDARITHKTGETEEPFGQAGTVVEVQDNDEALWRLIDGSANVLGGTAWLWARPDFTNLADVLFVDEAGQMSLANVLAMAPSARSIVLLGDPQQLEQPKKGSHPDGVDTSALQHILGEHHTIAADLGIFLPVTWRLAPSICEFTSEVFYEGRLASKSGLERQALAGSRLAGSGLWVVEVAHEGNRNASDEEGETAARLVDELTASGSMWIDEHGVARQLAGTDILVVAPYNAHVSRLADRLRETEARVGTVDKFQGQQAPVVLYSMATSRPQDAPRGLEFLYSLNRLNVATSRAQCAVIVVASPLLFTPECSTPRQMRLANALCRYRELARVVASNIEGGNAEHIL